MRGFEQCLEDIHVLEDISLHVLEDISPSRSLRSGKLPHWNRRHKSRMHATPAANPIMEKNGTMPFGSELERCLSTQ